MVSGALAAGEAFKTSVRKLLPFAINPTMTAEIFADTSDMTFVLAPPETPFCATYGELDFVSAGAISSSAMYALARIPGLSFRGRIFEPDTAELSNLNRYPLLLRSQLGLPKATSIAAQLRKATGMNIEAVESRYELGKPSEPLADTVLVGVDDIPTRWAVQRSGCPQIVVGATTHWSAMASFHKKGLGCAQCLHPEDDPNDAPIPTTACVSFWAGLVAATYLARLKVNQSIARTEQQIFITPFRPESAFRAPVPIRRNCPTCSLRY